LIKLKFETKNTVLKLTFSTVSQDIPIKEQGIIFVIQ